MIYLVILTVFLTLFIFANTVLIKIFYKPKPIENLKYYEDGYQIINIHINNKKVKKPNILKSLTKFIPKKIKNSNKVNKSEKELIRADINFTAEEITVIKIFSSFTISFLVYVVFKDIFILLVTLVLIWNLPKFLIYKKKTNRFKMFDEQINDGIVIIANSLKAGYSFLQAISVVVEETEDPFSKEFKKLLKEMSLGISMEDSLINILERVQSEDLKLLVNAILIQKDIGGNLSEILENISITIRERQKIQNELKTLTAQGKLSGIIISLLPVFLGVIIYLLNKEYMISLFTTKVGLAMVGCACINQLMGIFMIKKIVKVTM